jgi:hypothetical protein
MENKNLTAEQIAQLEADLKQRIGRIKKQSTTLRLKLAVLSAEATHKKKKKNGTQYTS